MAQSAVLAKVLSLFLAFVRRLQGLRRRQGWVELAGRLQCAARRRACVVLVLLSNTPHSGGPAHRRCGRRSFFGCFRGVAAPGSGPVYNRTKSRCGEVVMHIAN